ncbi:MAG TPA: hypothetical protein VN025_08355 [Candidatus Dormibacteraeota bacterium]|jgi:hypothetical protein|nr:hypothetical protein [Candidatus Dormibacteraeota bacterium]
MTINALVFGFGGILLLVAILGGGFELKEFKIPKVGGAPRVCSGLAGVFFILLGVGIGQSSAPEAQSLQNLQSVKASNQPSGEFTIYDNFGAWEPNRVSEQITIMIDGKLKGQLTADSQHTQAMLTIAVPQPGRYSYTVDATRVVNIGGTLYTYYGAGQGTINIEYDEKFCLVESMTGDTWLISIMDKAEYERAQQH